MTTLTLTLAPLGHLEFSLAPGRLWNVIAGTSFGAHVYARNFNGMWICGLRCSNGAVNRDGSGFMGKFYFDSLKLSLPIGWAFVPEVLRHGERCQGGVYTICQGGGHVFLPRWIMERRFAICQAGHEQKAVRILNGADLHIADPFIAYGPTRSRQPYVDRAAYQARFTGFVASAKHALAQGAVLYIEDRWDTKGVFGPWQPEGLPDAGPGDPGGYKINPSHGFEQCTAAVQFDKLSLGCIMDRTPVAAFDRTTGKPISLYDWKTPPDRQLMTNGTVELSPFLQGEWNNYTYKQLNAGSCPYEAGLAKYQARDNAHLIRYMQQAIPVIEYANDKMALDDFVMVMENARYGEWSDRPDQQVIPHPGESWVPPSLALKLKETAETPNVGSGAIDRAFGWTCYGAAMLIHRGQAGWFNWSVNMLHLRALAVDKFGCSGNDTSHSWAFQPGDSGVQKFHEDIIVIGSFALALQFGQPCPENLKYAENIYEDGPTFPYKYVTYQRGAMHWIATHHNGAMTEIPVPDNTSGEGGDPAHALAALAMCYRHSGNKKWLEIALNHWQPHATLAERKAWLQAQDNLGWGAEMLSVLQKGGY